MHSIDSENLHYTVSINSLLHSMISHNILTYKVNNVDTCQGVGYIRQELNSRFLKQMCWKQKKWATFTRYIVVNTEQNWKLWS